MIPGDTFRHARACDPRRSLYYAAASGDFNAIHVDPEAARAAGLPGPILHGMCTFAWLAEAAAAAAGDPGAVASLSARFSRPVLPGDEVAFEARCEAVAGGVARLAVAATNQRGEEVLKGAAAEVRLATSAPPATSASTATASPTPALPSTRRYGPIPYEAGLEKIRDFALAVSGGVPTRLPARPADPPPHPWHVDEAAGRASPWGAVIAPPTFAAVFAMPAFVAALVDPASGIELSRVLHGEQELRLGAPVRAGDRLRTVGWVAEDAPRGKLRSVAVETRSENQRGELVAEGRWTAIVR